ncbi:hypothetical protein LEP1GSC191_2155 [Leptospira borgpetersenii serovar Mini str. 201000851]|uniref:Uncharacterized protein n=2 Tax=Leptospira borgpetersenii TaxID=174 RepID=M3FD44_LEPBO|nr:hypothetical protein LEP1GSC128_2610 [Leptospira borgpetersenii str. 200801926]EMF99777.1 hypothetical protein LEP1GSC123_3238 [Leptospira borgpetersenii str. 200701203]ENO65124.1 hypothetical protein LEP1GSC191_2155 [Leptospira borgpetersenii serovar Mini str. 201000851]
MDVYSRFLLFYKGLSRTKTYDTRKNLKHVFENTACRTRSERIMVFRLPKVWASFYFLSGGD